MTILPDEPSKVCKKCGVSKALTDFAKDTRARDGLQYKCKACAKAYNVAWRVDYYADPVNKERRAAEKATWYAENKACIAATTKARSADPEAKARKATYNATYYAENKEHVLARTAAHAKAHPEVARNKEAQRRARKQDNGTYTVSAKDIRRILRKPCAYCGAPSEHIDHVIPLAKGGTHGVGNLTGTCAGCNLSKHAKLLSVWRHERKQHDQK